MENRFIPKPPIGHIVNPNVTIASPPPHPNWCWCAECIAKGQKILRRMGVRFASDTQGSPTRK